MPRKFAILLDGTIGVGKSTLGRELSLRFEGAFLDGDDFKIKGKPWYCSSLSTCRQIREAGLGALFEKPILFIARPVRCLDWLYFTRNFQRYDVGLLLIGLQASFNNITREERGRSFSRYELERMAAMIEEGYGARTYSDLHVRTDKQSIEDTVDTVEAGLRQLIGKMEPRYADLMCPSSAVRPHNL